jgi:four helix bundle protein
VESEKMNENSRSAYRDLVVWQKSMDFANAVIDLTERLVTERKHFRLVEQMEAAATSIPMNIAEGKGRFSRKEFKHFLFIARGSLYETMTLLELFKMRAWIHPPAFDELEGRANEIAKMINGLINSIPNVD